MVGSRTVEVAAVVDSSGADSTAAGLVGERRSVPLVVVESGCLRPQ